MRKIVGMTLSIFLVTGTGWMIIKGAGYGKPGITVLLFHQLGDQVENNTLAVKKFESLMKYLLRKQIKVLSLKELENVLIKKTSLSSRAVHLTFDDGLISFYDDVWPILKKYKFTASIYVVPEFVGKTLYHDIENRSYSLASPGESAVVWKQRFMDWGQIEKLKESGIAVQSHTMRHRALRLMDKESIKKDFMDSKAVIEKKLGNKVRWLSYPWGEAPADGRQLLKEAGYRAAFICEPKEHRLTGHRPLDRIPRYEISAFTSSLDKVLIVNGWMPVKEKVLLLSRYVLFLQLARKALHTVSEVKQ